MSLPAQSVPEDEDELVDVSGLVGRVLADRYKVTGLLGVGGIGRVYRAEHLVLKREVALKVLLEHYQCVPDLQRRFEREAMALAALTHPNVVSIIDFVSGRELTFLVMELVDGKDLDDVLEDEVCLAPDVAFDVMAQILSSLAYAHERDVIHRDLKPQNVLIRDLAAGRKHATILDFGLAKFMDGSGPAANLTKTGLIVGTPAYMAPEQASGGRADQRSDVYAAAVMFFEMLCGVPPFDGEGQELIRQHLLKPPPTLASMAPGALVSEELERFFQVALAKDGPDRYADGGAMLEALLKLPSESFVPSGKPDSAPVRAMSRAPTAIAPAPAVPRVASTAPAKPKRGWALVLAAALLGAAILGSTWMVLQQREQDPPPDLGEAPETVATEPTEPEVEPDFDVEPEPEEPGADLVIEPPEEAPSEEPAEEAPADAVERPPALNPWRRRTPPQLQRVRRRVTRGRDLTPAHVRQVTAYRRANPEDVRATLLLGQVYMARGQAVRALNQYRRAYQRDMTSRGDRRMRRDLIRMAASSQLHDRATEALVEIYGGEAADAVQHALERTRDAGEHERLEQTLAALREAG